MNAEKRQVTTIECVKRIQNEAQDNARRKVSLKFTGNRPKNSYLFDLTF